MTGARTMDLNLLKLRLIAERRKFTRSRRKAAQERADKASGLSDDFDRTPLLRENLHRAIADQRSHPDAGGETAVFSTFCGETRNFTFDKNNRARQCPHYFVSNNRTALDIVQSLGWLPIFLDLDISKNPILSAHQAKVAKALPHLFPDLARHRFLVYSDDKQRIKHDELPGFIETLTEKGGAMAVKLSPHIQDNILWEFTDSLFQDRYRKQAHRMLRFVLAQMEAGKTLEADRLFMTGFSIRDMAHPRGVDLSEQWYEDILACGIDCQLAFDFLAQGNPDIIDLPAPPRKKYLGKKIDPETGTP